MGSLKHNNLSNGGLKSLILKKMRISETDVHSTDVDNLVQAHILKRRAERKIQKAQAHLSLTFQQEFSKTLEDRDFQEEIERVVSQLESEETESAAEPLLVPPYFTVREVAKYKGITPQQVRRNCIAGKYRAEQVAGEHSSWRILADQFESEEGFRDFLQERNQIAERTLQAAQTAIELWQGGKNGIPVQDKIDDEY